MDRRDGGLAFIELLPVQMEDMLLLSPCHLVGLGFPSLCIHDWSWDSTNSQVAADTLVLRSLISLASSLPSFLGCLPGLGPCRIWSVTPTHILSHCLLCPLYPGCQHVHPSSLHRKIGILWWHTRHLQMQEDGHRSVGATGPGLWESPLIPRSVPHCHYSGHSPAGPVLLVADPMEDPCIVGSICLSRAHLLHTHFLPCPGTPPGPVAFAAHIPFSPPTTPDSTFSPFPTLRRSFLGYSSSWQEMYKCIFIHAIPVDENCIYFLHGTIWLFSKPLLWWLSCPCWHVPPTWGCPGPGFLCRCPWCRAGRPPTARVAMMDGK